MAHPTRRRKKEKKIPEHHRRRVLEYKKHQEKVSDREKGVVGKKIHPKYVVIILLGIFIFSLFVRVYFSLEIGTEEDGFRMTGGSDPYYHKHVVNYVLREHKHLEFDELLNYPLGGENPRPPLFDWLMAVVGLLLAPLFGGDYQTSTWWVVQLLPPFFGALAIFPVYYITKDALGQKYGLFAAFLFGAMPGAISHSTLGLADHDSYILFFVITSIYFYQRSLGFLKTKNYITDWFSPRDIKNGINSFVKSNTVALGYAMLSGFSILAVALAWKGFPYVMVIIFVYFLYQSLISRFKREDTLGLSLITLLTLSIPLFFSAPYYFTVVSPNWWTSPFYVFFAVVVLSYILVPTRDIPWVVVLGGFITLVVGVLLIVKFVLVSFWERVSGGMGYFLRTKLFETISEAQKPDFSNMVYSFGPALFFVAVFISLPYLIYISFKKEERKGLYLLTAWSVIAVYMARSAARFIFNATPIIAILGAWGIWQIIEWADFKSMWANMRKSRQRGVTNKFENFKRNVKLRHILITLFVVFLILIPAVKGAVDAGIPFEEKKKWDKRWYEALDSTFLTRWALPDKDDYNVSRYNALWYLGATGPSYPNDYWLAYFEWLKEQDKGLPDEEKPAFISWWDYGFWCINLGEHPTVADNFQNGYETAGSFITATGEDEGIAIFIHRLLEGEKTKEGLPANINNILLKYISNESVEKLNHIYAHPKDYKMKDVSLTNSVLRTVRDILLKEMVDENQEPDVNKLADLYHELQLETGKSIRYFAVDSRLFPFEPTNNIFYAPTVLSDQSTDKFYEIIYIEGNEDGEPTGREYTAKELEEAIKTNPNIRIIDQKLRYKKPFFETMFYKAYIGYYGEDVGMDINSGIPGIKGDLQNLQPMPGWMMKHFKLVYQTTYWNPYDKDEVDKHPDAWKAYSHEEASRLYEEKGGTISSGLWSGVVSIKYYHGAVLHGLVRTETGRPAPNVRVTVFDDMGIPHDSMVTDESGEYTLILPFGNVTIVASYGQLEDEQSKLLMSTDNILNRTRMYIYDYQAMRVRQWNISRDLVVESGYLSGKIYFDKNNDNKYSEKQDSVIKKGYLNLSNRHMTNVYYISEIGKDGSYQFTDIPPGEYTLSYHWKNYSKEVALFAEDNIFLPPTEGKKDYTLSKTKDIGIEQAKFQGSVRYANGTLASSVELVLLDINNTVFYYNKTDEDGKFKFDELLNSTYKLTVNLSNAEIYPEFRPDSYREMKSEGLNHNENILNLTEGITTEKNETIYDVIKVWGRTFYDGALKKNIEVEFYEPTLNILKTVQSDKEGYYEITLPYGSYRVVSAETDEALLPKAFYDTLTVTNATSLPYNIDQQPAYPLKGYLFYDENKDGRYEKGEGIPRVEALVVKEQAGKDIYMGERAYISVETNGSGGFEIYLPEGIYKFTYADRENGRSVTEEFNIKGGEPTRQRWLNISLFEGINLSGTVKRSGWLGNGDENDKVHNAQLVFTDQEGNEYITYSDEEGKYNLTLPQEGLYQVKVTAFGLKPYLEEIEVVANKVKHFMLKPEDVVVEGYINFVEKENSIRIPVEECQLTFTDSKGDLFVTTTDREGYYRIELQPEEYNVVAKKSFDRFLYSGKEFITLNFGEGRKLQNYTLYKYVLLSGRVVKNGEKFNATVKFVDSGLIGPDGKEFTVSVKPENENFEVELLPGSYTMIIVDEKNEDDYVRRISVEENTDFGKIDIKDEYSYLRGYVYDDKDEDGKKDSDETVGVTNIEFKEPYNGSYIKKTRSSSRFDFYLYNGYYQVFINKTGYRNFSDTLHLEDDQYDYNLKLIPEMVRLSGYVWYDYNHNNKFEPLEGVRYLEVTLKSRDRDEETVVKTNTSGFYSVELRPGDYDIKAFFYDEDETVKYTKVIKRVEIEAGKNKMKNLSLEKRYLVSGWCVDAATDNPLKNIEIKVLDRNGNEEEKTSSDDNGFYKVYLKNQETYYLYGKGKDEKDVRFAVIQKVKVEDSALTVDLNFTRGIFIEGKVYNGSEKKGVDIGDVKIKALDYGGLKFSKMTNDDGIFTITLPYGSYSFSASKEDKDKDDDRKVKYVLNKEILVGYQYDEESLPLECEKRYLYGVDIEFKNVKSLVSVFRGVTKEFELEVKNTGNSSETIEFSYEVSTSAKEYINVTVEEGSIDLKSGKSKTILVSVSVEEDAPLGFMGEVTVTAKVEEEKKLEAVASLSVVIQPRPEPDLVVKEISVDGQPRVGENYTISVVISNLVPYSNTDVFNVEFRVNSEVVGTKEGIKIREGENQTTVTMEVTAKERKEEIKVIVDSSGNVEEKDENNNVKTLEISVWESEKAEKSQEKGGSTLVQRLVVTLSAISSIAILAAIYIKRK